MPPVVKTNGNTSRDEVTRSYGYRSHSTTEATRSRELETSALRLYLAAVRSKECWISAASDEF